MIHFAFFLPVTKKAIGAPSWGTGSFPGCPNRLSNKLNSGRKRYQAAIPRFFRRVLQTF